MWRHRKGIVSWGFLLITRFRVVRGQPCRRNLGARGSERRHRDESRGFIAPRRPSSGLRFPADAAISATMRQCVDQFAQGLQVPGAGNTPATQPGAGDLLGDTHLEPLLIAPRQGRSCDLPVEPPHHRFDLPSRFLLRDLDPNDREVRRIDQRTYLHSRGHMVSRIRNAFRFRCIGDGSTFQQT